MSDTIRVGKRLVPAEHIALLEPFVPSAQSPINSDKPFQTRIVLLDRESVLSEDAMDPLAESLSMKVIASERVAISRKLRFTIEGFAPSEGFKPTKDYKSRLVWRDLDGQPQSKLMLSEPDLLLAIAVRGDDQETDQQETPRLPNSSTRRKRARKQPTPV